MHGLLSLKSSFRGLAALFALLFCSGCFSTDPLTNAGISLSPPAGWRPIAPAAWPVPGIPLAAWTGPGGSSLVVYRSLPVPGGNPTALGEALAVILENNPGLKVLDRQMVKLGTFDASRVDVIAPGTGESLAPCGIGAPVAPAGKSLVSTHRVVLTAVRPADTLTLLWHAPEADAAKLESDVRETLKSLKVTSSRLATTSY